MTITVTDIQLEKIFRKAYELGSRDGTEQALIVQGLLPKDVRKTEAIKRIGSSTYKKAVRNGVLIERKLDSSKKNSPIVVDRKQLNYVEKIMANPNF